MIWERVRRKKIGIWEKWYAWHPVVLSDGDWFWLEEVERMRYLGGGEGDDREIKYLYRLGSQEYGSDN